MRDGLVPEPSLLNPRFATVALCDKAVRGKLVALAMFQIEFACSAKTTRSSSRSQPAANYWGFQSASAIS